MTIIGATRNERKERTICRAIELVEVYVIQANKQTNDNHIVQTSAVKKKRTTDHHVTRVITSFLKPKNDNHA